MKKRLRKSQLIIPLLILMIISGQSTPFVIEKKGIKTDFTETSPRILEYINGNQTAYAVLQTTDGGFALAGWTDSEGAGGRDMWLVKTDTNGEAQWNQTYGGPGTEYASDLIQTKDGGFALTGRTDSLGAGGWDMWLVKTDPNGNIQWNHTYGGMEYDTAFAVLQTIDGGYALAGGTGDFDHLHRDMWLVKTDLNGNTEWNQTYGREAYDDMAYAFIQTEGGGYALAGSTIYSILIPHHGNMWIVKTDVNGTMEWNQSYHRKEDDGASSLVQTEDGGFVIAGWTDRYHFGIPWLVKTDAYGNMLWNKTIADPETGYIDALVNTSDGGFALAGKTSSFSAGGLNMWLVKTNTSGTVQWNYTYGEGGYDYGADLLQTTDDGYVLAGSTNSYGSGDWDMLLVKTNNMGILEWEHHYGGQIVVAEETTLTSYQTITDISLTKMSSIISHDHSSQTSTERSSGEKNTTSTTTSHSGFSLDLLQILPFVGVSGILAFVITLVIVVRRYQME